MNRTKKKERMLKILSLLIAISLWLYVMNETNPETDKKLKVKLKINNLASIEKDNLKVLNLNDNKQIEIKIKGLKREVDKIVQDNVVAFVDLTGYGEGQIKVPVHVSVDNPNVNISYYDPKEVLFDFEKIITVDKPISIKVEGDTAANCEVGTIKNKSTYVKLTGPRSRVNSVIEAVATVDVEGRSESTELIVPITLLDGEGRNINDVMFQPSIVDVDVQILKTKTVPIELVKIRSLPSETALISFELEPKSVKIKGNADVYNINSIKTKAIDVNAFIESPELELDFELPLGVTSTEPKSVKVKANIKELVATELLFNADDIKIENLKEGLKAEIDNSETVMLRLKDSEDKISVVNQENIFLYVDLKDFEEGSHEVELKQIGVSELEFHEIVPKIIKIEITNKE